MKSSIPAQSAQKTVTATQQTLAPSSARPMQLAASPSGTSTTAQLLQLQRIAGNRAARQFMTAQSSSAPIQRMEEEDVTTRSDQTKLKKLRKKFGEVLGFRSTLYHSNDITFEKLFERATDLNHLDSLIDETVKTAESKLASKTAITKTDEPEPPPVPEVKEEKKELVVTPPQKVKKKKTQKIDITSSFFSSAPRTVQEPVDYQGIVTNQLLNAWITSKPAAATITEQSISVSAETVYIYATVRIPDLSLPQLPRVNVYDIEIHYHPVPTSTNYLHVKKSAGSDAGNRIDSSSWLLPRGTASLRDAVSQWNEANPSRKSSHKW
ncbi:hypothetical protein [Paenibacillus sinopodophylli]|uniref:hypothetical protein n=1 Tax=Paenibacillus sinopodophylli TaxID=1837342 RepID=UPI00110CBF78|nr:hypothetical protein [Paenibacillus sinopodophylli]